MDLSILTLAFFLGFMSMLTPCSFSLLPSYITFYLNKEGEPESVGKGVFNGVLATLGAGAVMAVIGILAIYGISAISGQMYFRTVVGIVIICLGIFFLSGRSLPISVQSRLPKRSGPSSIFVFGALYSIATLGCAGSLFITLILGATATMSVGGAVVAVLIYIVGKGALLVPLTVAVATSRSIMIDRLQRFLPYVKIIGGVILIAMGIYLIVYQYL